MKTKIAAAVSFSWPLLHLSLNRLLGPVSPCLIPPLAQIEAPYVRFYFEPTFIPGRTAEILTIERLRHSDRGLTPQTGYECINWPFADLSFRWSQMGPQLAIFKTDLGPRSWRKSPIPGQPFDYLVDIHQFGPDAWRMSARPLLIIS